jgi:hypothetical protein
MLVSMRGIKEPLHTVGNNVNYYNYYGRQYGVSSKSEK